MVALLLFVMSPCHCGDINLYNMKLIKTITSMAQPLLNYFDRGFFFFCTKRTIMNFTSIVCFQKENQSNMMLNNSSGNNIIDETAVTSHRGS